MNRIKGVTLMVSLFLLVFTAADVSAERREKREVEDGGWYVSYSSELTENDAAQGIVEPGLSIYEDRESLRTWAEGLIRQTSALIVNSLGTAALDNFGFQEQRQARKVTIRAVKDMLRSGQGSDSEILRWGQLEFKAGVLEYGKRRDYGKIFFAPYVALRLLPRWAEGENHHLHKRDNYHSQPHFSTGVSLTSAARNVGNRQWEWTAYIDGPDHVLRQIRSVRYFLPPFFNPNVFQGDRFRLGHPVTTIIGQGDVELKAEVIFEDGTMRTYLHQMSFR